MASSSSPSSSSLHYRSRFGDTTLTKVFVGGLAWETPTAELRRFFEQWRRTVCSWYRFASCVSTLTSEATISWDWQVTFRDPESARRSVVDPNPVIDGRRANCNIAALGRQRPSPPREHLDSRKKMDILVDGLISYFMLFIFFFLSLYRSSKSSPRKVMAGADTSIR
ncbi:hypothetical protein C4D60_Mb08t23820 [Musa balbisiana]|uniref:RRM domain-containing protein n=1 Tax=Musa balbisiana TaxID=52838 RepID=A0A4S8K603_MUSBA|nr:hypothetical protein C4D60_Mb08t23820 [Musa balbisiana]